MDGKVGNNDFFVQIRPRAETDDKFIRRAITNPNSSSKNLILQLNDET